MMVKTLSVKQPYASLICHGIKTVENRTWKTDYRGKLLIHASGNNFAYPDSRYLPKKYREDFYRRMESEDQEKAWKDAPESMLKYCWLLEQTYKFYGKDIDTEIEHPDKWLKESTKEYGFFMPSQAIIGEVTLSDIVDNIYDANDDWCEKNSTYYWKLTDPYVYNKPIINVVGRLRLWDFES